LAEDTNNLGLLHAEMGKLREAESKSLEALKLRKQRRFAGDCTELELAGGLYFSIASTQLPRFFQESDDESLSTRVQVSLTGFRLDLAWPRPYAR